MHEEIVHSKKGKVIASWLLENGWNPNHLIKGQNPLHLAVSSEVGEVVEEILPEIQDVNFQDPISLRTPLHIAASLGNLPISRMLVNQGAGIDLFDIDGMVIFYLQQTTLFFCLYCLDQILS